MELKMINLGIFYEYLKVELEDLHSKKEKEKDPYTKQSICDRITLMDKVINEYIGFMR